MDVDPEDVDRLRRIASRLEPTRKRDPFVNDLWLRTEDLRNLGQFLLRGDGYYCDLAEQEAADLETLRTVYGSRLHSVAEWLEIEAIAERLITEGRKNVPPPEGYLSYKVLVPEIFDFLISDFGMRLVWAEHAIACFDSALVRLTLYWPTPYLPGVDIRAVAATGPEYWPEALFWRAGRREFGITWPDRPTNAEEARAWFEGVAAMLKHYARDVLTDEPGALESLAAAAAERERALDAHNMRRYIEEHGHPPPG